MMRTVVAAALLLTACGPRPGPARLVRTCSPSVEIYDRGGARFLLQPLRNPVQVEAGADLDAICEGYDR